MPGIDICTVSCIGPMVIGVSISEIPVSLLAATTPYTNHQKQQNNRLHIRQNTCKNNSIVAVVVMCIYEPYRFSQWQCHQLSAIAAAHPPAWSVGSC